MRTGVAASRNAGKPSSGRRPAGIGASTLFQAVTVGTPGLSRSAAAARAETREDEMIKRLLTGLLLEAPCHPSAAMPLRLAPQSLLRVLVKAAAMLGPLWASTAGLSQEGSAVSEIRPIHGASAHLCHSTASLRDQRVACLGQAGAADLLAWKSVRTLLQAHDIAWGQLAEDRQERVVQQIGFPSDMQRHSLSRRLQPFNIGQPHQQEAPIGIESNLLVATWFWTESFKQCVRPLRSWRHGWSGGAEAGRSANRVPSPGKSSATLHGPDSYLWVLNRQFARLRTPLPHDYGTFATVGSTISLCATSWNMASKGL
jgi:hypothetical protein